MTRSRWSSRRTRARVKRLGWMTKPLCQWTLSSKRSRPREWRCQRTMSWYQALGNALGAPGVEELA